MNGTEAKQRAVRIEGNAINLSAAQQKHLLRLIAALGRATESHKAAQAALDLAQQNANEFIVYCAEECAIQLDREWSFDQNRMAFLRQAQEVSHQEAEFRAEKGKT
jgi:hypothetical protein